jgi:hypothetical protein
MKESFFILPHSSGTGDRDVIQECNSGLKVCVINLNEEAFKPDPNEIQYYGETENEDLAFETVGYHGEFRALILTMISRYALYINEPDMKLRELASCA